MLKGKNLPPPPHFRSLHPFKIDFFSPFLSDTHVRMLEDYIQETILEQNKLAAGSDRSVSADGRGKIHEKQCYCCTIQPYFFHFLPSGFQPDGHPAVRAGPDSHLPTGRRHARDRPCEERGDSPPDPAQESHIGHLLTCVFFCSQISPLLTSEVHSVRAGRHLATKLNILVQQHFDLASTTITNIPMKVK